MLTLLFIGQTNFHDHKRQNKTTDAVGYKMSNYLTRTTRLIDPLDISYHSSHRPLQSQSIQSHGPLNLKSIIICHIAIMLYDHPLETCQSSIHCLITSESQACDGQHFHAETQSFLFHDWKNRQLPRSTHNLPLVRFPQRGVSLIYTKLLSICQDPSFVSEYRYCMKHFYLPKLLLIPDSLHVQNDFSLSLWGNKHIVSQSSRQS